MKFKIAAGAEFDVLTEKELRTGMRDVLASMTAELAAGDRYRRFQAYADISGSAVTIGDREQQIGPAEGFVWSVKRLAVVASDDADTFAVHIGDTSTSSMVHPAVGPYTAFDSNQLVMYPGDRLVVAGSSLASTGRVWVTGQVREIPVQMVWRL